VRIRTDDEVYRVDAVWLGPPKATMPWRARYVAWGVGVVVFLVVLTVLRRMGISLFWSIAWGMVITIILTRFITSRISHERPLGAVTAMWVRELTAPREVTTGAGGAVSATRVRVRGERPRPRQNQARQKQGRQPVRQHSRQHRNKHSKRGTPTSRAARDRRGGGVRTPTQARA
jgi:hypothetical protein